jgi:hypothetical protein
LGDKGAWEGKGEDGAVTRVEGTRDRYRGWREVERDGVDEFVEPIEPGLSVESARRSVLSEGWIEENDWEKGRGESAREKSW